MAIESSSLRRSRRSPRGRKWNFKNPLVWGSALGGLLVILLAVIFWPGGDDNSNKKPEQPKDQERKVVPLVNPGEVQLPSSKIGLLKVFTQEPGALVIIDGEPVRDETGHLVRTPCEITLERGTHEVIVTRHGYKQAASLVNLGEEDHQYLDPEPHPEGLTEGILASPYFEAEVGQPIPLEAINTSGYRELDPYLTPDGLTLWFVSDRGGNSGLYSATRPSVYHPFGEPVFSPASIGSGLPATPSTAHGSWESVVFVTPETARIMALTQQELGNVSSAEKEYLLARQKGDAIWPSSQVLEAGLQLYFVAEEKGTRRTYEVARKTLEDKFELNRAREITLPGNHPCLSADGLRQYVYDGRTLRRATRSDVNSPFSTLETVRELVLPNYIPDPTRRQYFLSEDEQWLFYCADPQRGADLYMVRVSAGKGWGVVPRGKTIETAPTPQTNPMPETEQPIAQQPEEQSTVNPKTQPLPYIAFREQFVATMRQGDYEKAIADAQAALEDPRFAADHQVLQWDLEEAQQVAGFWKTVREALQAMKPGTELRLNSVKVQFESFSDDKLTASARTKSTTQPISELKASDLVSIVDNFIKPDDAEKQLQVAMYLYYNAESSRESVQVRLDRAGQKGQEFTEGLAERQLHLVTREMERDNPGRAYGFIQELQKSFPNSQAAQQANSLLKDLYDLAHWIPQKRTWTTGTPGEYHAPLTRVEGAFLMSEKSYRAFELQLEWKTEGVIGKGGVYFHYPGEGDVFAKSFKIQLANDAGGPVDAVSTGALYKLEAPKRNVTRPQGEWNQLVLRVIESKVQVTINGVLVLDTYALEEDKGESGHILLDGEIGGITYRNILLLPLPVPTSEDPMKPKPNGPVLLDE